jgi:hypothetical protein
MRQNSLVVFLLIGLAIGALVGYVTRPETAEIKFGPISVEVQGNRVARDGGPMTSSQVQHVAIIALIGGLIGLGLGFAVKSGRMKF